MACSNLRQRDEILGHLRSLPQAIPAGHEEVMQFTENYNLMGKALEYIDMHLLASAFLTRAFLLALDKKLNGGCDKAGVGDFLALCDILWLSHIQRASSNPFSNKIEQAKKKRKMRASGMGGCIRLNNVINLIKSLPIPGLKGNLGRNFWTVF